MPADKPNTDSDSSSESEEVDLQNRAAGLGTFAAMKWMVNGLAPVPGRKSIIFLSEGFKLQSRSEGVATLNGSLTDQASRTGVVIYSIDPRGIPSLALGAADDVRNSHHPPLRANIAETLSPALITEQGENGNQNERESKAERICLGQPAASSPAPARPNPDVVADARRRSFSLDYKRRILKEAEAVKAIGGILALDDMAPGA